MLFENFWEFLNTEISKFDSLENVEIGVEAGTTVVEFAKTLQEELDLENSKISSLLDFLTSPPLKIVASGLPFVSIAVELLKLYKQCTCQEPSLEQCIAIVSQEAYLKSCGEVLKWKENQNVLSIIKHKSFRQKFIRNIKQIDTILQFDSRQIEFDREEAQGTLVCFRESNLSKVFNSFLTEYLVQAGLNQDKSEILSQRVACNTPYYMLEVLSELRNSVKTNSVQNLSNLFLEGGRDDLKKHHSLNQYLKNIEQKTTDSVANPVLNQNFSLQEVYVPLKARYLDHKGNPTQNIDLLENFVKKWLMNPEPQQISTVMCIQAEPGRGKSVFCRIFANFVREHFYPIWIPIVIQLRDIRGLQPTFPIILEEAIHEKFATDDWLKDKNQQFLFFLDGFDELLMQERSSEKLKHFLGKLHEFREYYKNRHRVLITCRTLAAQTIAKKILYNLEQLEILPMDEGVQEEWFSGWSKIVGESKSLAFKKFLRKPNCPEQLRGSPQCLQDPTYPDREKDKDKKINHTIGLAQEPLMLCLLAIMHRDNDLKIEMFEENLINNKISIYQKTINWMLARTEAEWDKLEKEEIEKKKEILEHGNIQKILKILREIGLCVIQSGGEYTSIEMVEENLSKNDDQDIKKLIQEAKQRDKESPLRQLLVSFYLRERSEGSIEFIHKSFGEFFYAARLKESLEGWSEPGRGRENDITRDQMNREIYDLFSYGGLSQEIVEYLIELLKASRNLNTNKIIRLFSRLKEFYFDWCNGKFIDAIPDNYPRNKMDSINKYLQKQNRLSLRSIDVYTGLNIMILLLALYRYARTKDKLKQEMSFYSCEKDPTQLMRIIGYSDCIELGTFARVVGPFMSYIRLNDADLSGADLGGVNLLGAHLSRANLNGTYLRGTNLENSRLKDTNLKRVNLESANLTNTYLIDANLSSASLSNANLSNANLCGANLSDAKLNDANLSSAYLGGTNCCDANFNRANLSEAQLCSSDLSSANLNGTNVKNADFRGSNLNKIVWDWATNFEKAVKINRARNLSDELKNYLSKKKIE